MKTGMRSKLTAMSVALTMASTQARAAGEPPRDPVRVGIMDLKADVLTYDVKGVSIEYRAFTPEGCKAGFETQETGVDHGAVVATAFVRHYRRLDPRTPIEVYAANPFAITGGKGLKLDFDKAIEALEWMHSKGVRIVVTAFNSTDGRGAGFMRKADDLGMIVFAAYSNERGAGRVFPASDPRAIAVVDTSKGKVGLEMVKGSGREFDGAKAGVNFSIDGGVPMDAYGPIKLVGSSFAAPKAAAYGAFLIGAKPGLSRDELVDAMMVATRVLTVSRGNETLPLPYMGDAATDARFLKQVAAMRRTALPDQVDPESEPATIAMQASALARLADRSR